MDRKKLAKYILFFLALPFAGYLLIDCIAGYIPPTESYQKAPFQFEEAFNEQMAQYGMSIDIDSVNFSYGSNLNKTVPIVCDDGSKITCIYFPTSERRKSIIQYMIFRQELTGKRGEKVYIEPLMQFLMDEFETGMTGNKDESFDPVACVSYNEALRLCREFVDGDDKNLQFSVASAPNKESSVELARKADGIISLSISLSSWYSY